jgi:hypothetical protein
VKARVVERAIQLVDGVRPERIANLWAIERDSSNALIGGLVIRHVREVLESGHNGPLGRVKEVADGICHTFRL